MLIEFNHKLRAGLTGLGCSAVSFSALAVPPLTCRRMSQQYVSQIITGTKEFDSTDDARDFLEVINTMEYLQQIVQPRVPINWQNVLELKDVLASIHEQRKNDVDPLSVQNFYVRLTRVTFFKGIDSRGVVTTINPEKDGAAFKDLSLAQQVVQKLKQMDVTAQVERLTGPRRKSSLTTSLEELGFAPEQEATGGSDGTD
jgi:hypothetical protein